MNIFSQAHIQLTPKQEQQMEELFLLFESWNTRMNLSSIRKKEDVFEKHLLDSLLPVSFLQNKSFQKALDIGSGGGFPILPLSLYFPQCKFHALDSVGKKMKAVQDISETLHLDIQTHHGRIETFGHLPEFREQFDLVTSRALAPWPVLLEYALPFVRIGGTFCAYQGPAILDDLVHYKNLEQKLGGKIIQTHTKTLPSGDQRLFVEILKTKKTPNRFPREVGTPKREPLT